jgi:inorganic pyrophosphatase/exopolyphosphatase
MPFDVGSAMESFDYDDYSETVEKFIKLMPKLAEHIKTFETEDLIVMKKYFDYQHKLNQRMSKKINEIVFLRKSKELLPGKMQ